MRITRFQSSRVCYPRWYGSSVQHTVIAMVLMCGPVSLDAAPVTVTSGDPADFGRVVLNASGVTRTVTLAKQPSNGQAQAWTSTITVNDGGISFPASGTLPNGNNPQTYTINLNTTAAGTGSTGQKNWTISVQGNGQSLGTNPDIAVSATVILNRDLSGPGTAIDFGKILVGTASGSQNAVITADGLSDSQGTRLNLTEGSASSDGVTVNNASNNLFDSAGETHNVSVQANFTTSGLKSSSVNLAPTRISNGESSDLPGQVLDVSVLVPYTADVYEAASLTVNNSGAPKASGSLLTIDNAATSDGGQRAAAEVVSVSLVGAPGWQVTGINGGQVINENSGITGTALFDATGKLNGAHKADFSVTLEHADQTIAGTAANDLGVATWKLKHVVTGNTGNQSGTFAAGTDFSDDFNGDKVNGVSDQSIGSVATLLDGTLLQQTTIAMSWNEADSGGEFVALSDLLELSGTGNDVFVLQISYDESLVVGSEDDVFLAWWNGSAWVNAVEGNSSGTPTGPILGGYDGDLTLGRYGVDTTANVVWAVIDHNSEFGVFTIPEPGTIGLALAGLMLMYRRRARD